MGKRMEKRMVKREGGRGWGRGKEVEDGEEGRG